MATNCSAIRLNGKQTGIGCKNKATKFIDHTYSSSLTYNHSHIKHHRIYLCGYHLNRYKNNQNVAVKISTYPQEEILIIPDSTSTRKQYDILNHRRRHPIEFLPIDCWKLILTYLPPPDKILARLTCKSWSDLIGKIRGKIDFSLESWKSDDYFIELVKCCDITKINFASCAYTQNKLRFVMNQGVELTCDMLYWAIILQSYEEAFELVSKGIKFPPGYSIPIPTNYELKDLLLAGRLVDPETWIAI